MKSLKHAPESGFTLVESLIVLGVVGLTLAAMLQALSSGALGLNTLTSRNQAANLAVAQMEYVKAQPFVAPPTTYPLGVSAPAGFVVAAQGQTVPGADANVQRIVVTVTRDGRTIASLESIKVNHP